MIYTSYFANVKSLPSEVIPIAICGGVPEWWCGLQYRKLAPKREFFNEWKSSGDNDYYVKCYYEQVLSHLDPAQVYKELYKFVEYTGSYTENIALLCYEKPEDFCHRHLVAEWFNKNGIVCKEWINNC